MKTLGLMILCAVLSANSSPGHAVDNDVVMEYYTHSIVDFGLEDTRHNMTTRVLSRNQRAQAVAYIMREGGERWLHFSVQLNENFINSPDAVREVGYGDERRPMWQNVVLHELCHVKNYAEALHFDARGKLQDRNGERSHGAAWLRCARERGVYLEESILD